MLACMHVAIAGASGAWAPASWAPGCFHLFAPASAGGWDVEVALREVEEEEGEVAGRGAEVESVAIQTVRMRRQGKAVRMRTRRLA